MLTRENFHFCRAAKSSFRLTHFTSHSHPHCLPSFAVAHKRNRKRWTKIKIAKRFVELRTLSYTFCSLVYRCSNARQHMYAYFICMLSSGNTFSMRKKIRHTTARWTFVNFSSLEKSINMAISDKTFN